MVSESPRSRWSTDARSLQALQVQRRARTQRLPSSEAAKQFGGAVRAAADEEHARRHDVQRHARQRRLQARHRDAGHAVRHQMTGLPGGLSDIIAKQLERQMSWRAAGHPVRAAGQPGVGCRRAAHEHAQGAGRFRAAATARPQAAERPARHPGRLHDHADRARNRLGPARDPQRRRQLVEQPVRHQGRRRRGRGRWPRSPPPNTSMASAQGDGQVPRLRERRRRFADYAQLMKDQPVLHRRRVQRDHGAGLRAGPAEAGTPPTRPTPTSWRHHQHHAAPAACHEAEDGLSAWALPALMSLGVRAMSADYAALQATGHNISSANTEGYFRARAWCSRPTAASSTGAGYSRASTSPRCSAKHSDFLTREASTTKAIARRPTRRSSQLQQLEKVFPLGEDGIGYAATFDVQRAGRRGQQARRHLGAPGGAGARRQFATRVKTAGEQLDHAAAGVTEELIGQHHAGEHAGRPRRRAEPEDRRGERLPGSVAQRPARPARPDHQRDQPVRAGHHHGGGRRQHERVHRRRPEAGEATSTAGARRSRRSSTCRHDRIFAVRAAMRSARATPAVADQRDDQRAGLPGAWAAGYATDPRIRQADARLAAAPCSADAEDWCSVGHDSLFVHLSLVFRYLFHSIPFMLIPRACVYFIIVYCVIIVIYLFIYYYCPLCCLVASRSRSREQAGSQLAAREGVPAHGEQHRATPPQGQLAGGLWLQASDASSRPVVLWRAPKSSRRLKTRRAAGRCGHPAGGICRSGVHLARGNLDRKVALR